MSPTESDHPVPKTEPDSPMDHDHHASSSMGTLEAVSLALAATTATSAVVDPNLEETTMPPPDATQAPIDSVHDTADNSSASGNMTNGDSPSHYYK